MGPIAAFRWKIDWHPVPADLCATSEGGVRAMVSVNFHGGPIAGTIRAYPADQGEEIALPCESGDSVIYRRDRSEVAEQHHTETGLVVYECVYNGLAAPAPEVCDDTR